MDKPIKLPKVEVEIPEPVDTEKKIVDDANDAAATKLAKQEKDAADAAAEEGTSVTINKPMGIVEEQRIKAEIKETQEKLRYQPEKTQAEKDREFNDSVEALAKQAEVKEHKDKVKSLTKQIDQETDMENKPKLIKKLEAATEVAKAD